MSNPTNRSFADELLELFLFFKVFGDLYSERICVLPYFCPYRQFTRAGFTCLNFHLTALASGDIGEREILQ